MARLIPGSNGMFRGRDHWSGYDTAQACVNGHVTNSVMQANPSHSQKHCSICGAPTISACESCKQPIRGHYHNRRVHAPYALPAFCHECGQPYAWTVKRIEVAKALAEESDNLEDSEKQILKDSIDDIVRETPATQLASTRFKKYASKAGTGTLAAMRDILVDVVSETVKKGIWG